MTRKIVLVLVLIAGLGFGFTGQVGDEMWTISPYASCADDGNPVMCAPSLAPHARPEARLLRDAVPVLMGAPRPGPLTSVSGVARTASRLAPSPPPPQRC